VQELSGFVLPRLPLPRWGRFFGFLIISELFAASEVAMFFFDTRGVRIIVGRGGQLKMPFFLMNFYSFYMAI
jgi:hypothetical protein